MQMTSSVRVDAEPRILSPGSEEEDVNAQRRSLSGSLEGRLVLTRRSLEMRPHPKA